jgi:hypothetical protein
MHHSFARSRTLRIKLTFGFSLSTVFFDLAISTPLWIIAWIETIFIQFRGPKALVNLHGCRQAGSAITPWFHRVICAKCVPLLIVEINLILCGNHVVSAHLARVSATLSDRYFATQSLPEFWHRCRGWVIVYRSVSTAISWVRHSAMIRKLSKPSKPGRFESADRRRLSHPCHLRGITLRRL